MNRTIERPPKRAWMNATSAMLLTAAGFGTLAVLGARAHLDERIAIERERLAPHQAVTHVVVAKTDLPAGSLVDVDTMSVRALPTDGLPSSAVRPEAFDAVDGGRLVAPLKAGEPLITAGVNPANSDAFAARVRAGVRAMTIAVDEVNALSGMLQPGDRIDLLVSARPPGRSGTDRESDITMPLMQDVTVLATGRQFRPADAAQGPARTYTTITIEAEPAQAKKLIVAQRSGRLTAILRNPQDRSSMDRAPMDITHLLGSTPHAAPSGRTEIIVGGRGSLERQTQPVDRLSTAISAALPTTLHSMETR